MKKLLLSLLLFPLVLSCVDTEQLKRQEEEKSKMLEELRQARVENMEKDSLMNDALKFFNEIEENLEEIKKREGLINLNTQESTESADKKEKIVEDIQLINSLMARNHQRVTELQRIIQKQGLKIDELQRMLDRMILAIDNKNAQIDSLKGQLANMKIEYKLLAMENVEQAELIDMQTTDLNTAYYCFGTSKELRENGVITKEGGFIGIGKTEKLTEDFNKRYFTQMDVTTFSEVELKAKKAKVITSHPSSSYKITGSEMADKLVIKDAEKFWSVSKYLVIVVEGK
ncbi:MAG: hypothetical protein COA57_12575 [Flavobacteriales bacterium]|nr:MAG: hypothetical protein COA57_12575 [Flavobacteriales bacterium]